jgi:DNA polymerase-1
MNKRLYLVDATAFCYRAFYALHSLTTSFGQPTNAVFGFIRMLNKILKEHEPQYLAVCFDVSRDTFRTKKFAEYKMQRPPMPDGLSSQIPLIKKVVGLLGIAILEKEGFEADDVIATLVKLAKAKGLATTIISSDKDILQLVDKDTVVFSPYKDEGTTYDSQAVLERYGVRPQNFPDILALMGDSVDNIPGIPGIGEKTAVALIKEFGSLDNLLGHLEKLDKEKLKQAISENLDKIKLNQELTGLNSEVKMDFKWQDLEIGQPDIPALRELFQYLEFKTLLKELPGTEVTLRQVAVQAVSARELLEIASAKNELFLCGSSLEDLVFSCGEKIMRLEAEPQDLKKILEDPQIKKISHDLKKLKVWLHREGINLQGLYFDTLIAAYLANPAADHALEGESADRLSRIMESQAALEKKLKEASLEELFRKIEMPLVEVLAEMEISGVKLDKAVLSELSKDIEKRLIKLIADIYALSGTQFNINSPKQLRDILFERLKLPVVKRSKTGPSTDEEVLRKLADKHELPALLLEYRQLMKLKTTYVDTLPELADEQGRIHTSFNQTGTETGRLSSSEPNLQNIPVKTDLGRQIRRAFIAGSLRHCLVSSDYSQIELRILAHLCGDERLISAFKKDKDIHRSTAALIYGLEENSVTDQMRETAKRVNFGIIYGLSAYGLSRDLNIPAGQAQEFIDAYFTQYPAVRDYLQSQIESAQKQGFVCTLMGRRRYIPEINNKNQAIRQFAERQAVNAPIQGSASDLIKMAMIDIQHRIEAKGWESRMVLQIHDELLFDAPKEELAQLVPLVRERMENVLKLGVPIKVQIKTGQNWLDMEEGK